MKPNKIVSLKALSEITLGFRKVNQKIIHCHGCFDLLHIGHIRYLQQARQMGDVLVVTITPDRYVDKGPNRPAFTENLRAEAVASLDCVNYVAINAWPTAEETLRMLRPNVYVKGSDFDTAVSDITGKLSKEEQAAKEIDAELTFTRDIVFSSTRLINRFFMAFPNEVQEYLNVFRTRYGVKEVIDLIERMSTLKVLVIGDTVIDDYQYCHTIGSSSKDPVLAVKFDSYDVFAGGVLAVANHIANFAQSVRLVTVLGERNSYEDFIRSKLADNISPHFVVQDQAPTIIKRRFVEGYSLNKMLEVYIMDDSGLTEEKDKSLRERLASEIGKYDLVVAADFGHGAISQKMRKLLASSARFLAVNTQANSGNRGFHTVTRYSRADFISIAEHEIRLEMRDVNGEIGPMVKKLSKQLGCGNFVVTRGKKGSLSRSANGTVVEVPAFAQKVVDRIGAGDAFLSITALAACLDAPSELIGFLGNAAGALAVEILGNQKPIDKAGLTNSVISLLK